MACYNNAYCFGMRVACITYDNRSRSNSEVISKRKEKQVTARYWPLRNWPSELMIRQIMQTIHLDHAEAMTMAIRMLITQLIMASNMPAHSLEESQGAA